MHCSGKKDAISCYSKSQLLELANEYNQRYSNRIPLSGSKADLWNHLTRRMINSDTPRMPRMPRMPRIPRIPRIPYLYLTPSTTNHTGGSSKYSDSRPWLSTADIHDKLVEYQAHYPNFLPIGPVPIDFCNIGHILCKMDVIGAYKKGTRTIGVVFNTDPSHLPGKHWISMFIDMRAPIWEINYFDSFGNSSLAPEIMSLIQHLDHTMNQAGIRHVKKLNCSNNMCTNSIMHQMNDSDCGVYSIHFIVKRLEGVSWEDLVRERSTELNDDNMGRMRKYYFPNGLSSTR